MLWAVPAFIMVSGALLLESSKGVTLKKIFGRYILRMVIALFVFSLLFELFDEVFVTKDVGISFLKKGIENALFNTGWSHMWYLYMMIAVYLLLPFYKMITKAASKNELVYLLCVYFVCMSLIPFIQIVTDKRLYFYIFVYSVYPMYLFLGYVLHNGKLKINKTAAAFMAVAGLASLVILTIVQYTTKNDELSARCSQFFLDYAFPGTIIASVGIFVMFIADNSTVKPIDKIFMSIDSCSFGIYLIHMAVLKYVVAVWGFDPLKNGGVPMILLMTVCIFLVSYLITLILKKIPGVKKIL